MSERVRGRAWLGFRQVAEPGRAGAGDADNTGSGGQAAGPNCWETALLGALCVCVCMCVAIRAECGGDRKGATFVRVQVPR